MTGSRRLTVRAPAKINLALRVLRRLPDGYHELDTVFQAVDLWDTLEIRPADELVLKVDEGQPAGEANLVYRAADLLRERFPAVDRGAALSLHKTIPMQAGLGGGSSDAAAALLGCARLWDLDVEREELNRLGAELGADVPFFLTGGTARGRHRGDRLEALPPFPQCSLLLGRPSFGLSTAEVFSAVASRLTLPGNGVNLPVFSGHKWPDDNDFGFMINDLEQVAFELRPELRTVRDRLLDHGAGAALLSGSGSTVFGLFVNPEASSKAQRRLSESFEEWTFQLTRTVDAGIQMQVAN